MIFQKEFDLKLFAIFAFGWMNSKEMESFIFFIVAIIVEVFSSSILITFIFKTTFSSLESFLLFFKFYFFVPSLFIFSFFLFKIHQRFLVQVWSHCLLNSL